MAVVQPLTSRSIVVAIPEFPIATREAYGWLDDEREEASEVPDEPRHGSPELSWDAVAAEAGNDFEGPVFRRYPRLKEIRDRLLEHGARPALLAGSGSTVFGAFESREEAVRCAESLRPDSKLRVLVTRTRMR